MNLLDSLSSLIKEMTSKRTLHQMWKWATINGIGMGINIALFYIFTRHLHLYDIYAVVIAIVLAGLWNFILNKKITFKDWQKHH